MWAARRKRRDAAERHGMSQRWGTDRTEAFSDGVFAIAITLLVLDIGVPRSGYDDLFRAILDEWPSYLAYVTSFMTIGGVWLAHHGMFARLKFVDRRLMRVNLLLLMVVSFLPYPTRLVSEAIKDANAERVAVLFYGTTLFVITALLAVMIRTAASNRELIDEAVTDAELQSILRSSLPDPGFYIGVIVMAIIAPRVAAFGFLVVSLLLVVRARGEEHVSEARSAP
jgi:uncharacterized membrane protein